MLGISNEALQRAVQEEQIRRRKERRERIATAILANVVDPHDLLASVRSSFVAGAIDLADELIAQLDQLEAQEAEQC